MVLESTDDTWSRVYCLWLRLRCRFEGVNAILKDALDSSYDELQQRFFTRFSTLTGQPQEKAMRRLVEEAARLAEDLRQYAGPRYQSLKLPSEAFSNAMESLMRAVTQLREELQLAVVA